MMGRDVVLFYKSFADAADCLSNAQRLKFYDAIFKYAFYGEEILEDKSAARALFIQAKIQIDKNNQRYENGKKGGRPKKEKPNENQTETNSKAKGKVKVKDKYIDIDNTYQDKDMNDLELKLLQSN